MFTLAKAKQFSNNFNKVYLKSIKDNEIDNDEYNKINKYLRI